MADLREALSIPPAAVAAACAARLFFLFRYDEPAKETDCIGYETG